MTYKSIAEAINALQGKSLFCLTPETGEEETPRIMFVTKDLLDAVGGPFPATSQGERLALARSTLDGFTLGDFITIGENPFDKDADAMMARVHPITEEAFDFRSFDTLSGMRILGCFSAIDEFVALTWHFREDLAPDDWDDAVSECKAEWRKLFGALSPHSGKTVNDYISYNVSAV